MYRKIKIVAKSQFGKTKCKYSKTLRTPTARFQKESGTAMVETYDEASVMAQQPQTPSQDKQTPQLKTEEHTEDVKEEAKGIKQDMNSSTDAEKTKTPQQTNKTNSTVANLQSTEDTDESDSLKTVKPNYGTSAVSQMDAALQMVLRVDRRFVSGNEDGTLPKELAVEAEGDIHEKPEWVDRDVQALREMVEAEPGLKSRVDKPFLLAFLRARKFDYDKAMAMIRGYYKARQENADMYVDLLPSSLDHVWPLRMQTVLPSPDQIGRTVLVFRTGAWLPEICGLDDVFRSQVVLLEHVVRLPVTQLRGIAAIVDCAGLSMTQAYYLTPTHIRRMISVIQEVFPLRFKALHFVNEPSIFDWVFSLVKPFLSETIKGRLHFHGEDLTSLHEHIPAHELPEELGGSQGPMDNSELVENMKKHEEYFKDHFAYGFEPCEEPARQGSVMDAVSDMGSFIGSYYRRMCID